MSGRRSRRQQPQQQSLAVSRNISDDQIIHLISNLQQLVPELQSLRNSHSRVSASRVLKETCNHIRNLQKEMDDLSDRISHLLSTLDHTSEEAFILRSLLLNYN